MAQIDHYLRLAMQNRASDIHFSAGELIRMRIDGDLVPIDQTPVDSGQLRDMIFEILTEPERSRFLENKNLDKSHSVEGLANFRVNVFMNRIGIGAVLRTIPSVVPTFEQLNSPPILKDLTQESQGLILVSGATGSGKSTTLAAMINYINENFPYHILTAEDPVEFVHQSKKSLVNQREIGASCPSFADALKYALREDPDVILVGEMRDLETIALALTAAETGHLVFGTLHTRGAAASVDRIIDSFPSNQQAMIRTMLAESLRAVISQALLKKLGGGRVAAYEIMVVNSAISNLIREGKTFQMNSVIQTGKKDGMNLMDNHIRELLSAGLISKEEAEANVENINTLAGVQVRPNQNRVAATAAARPMAVNNQSVRPPVGTGGGPPPMGRPNQPLPQASNPAVPSQRPPAAPKTPPGMNPPGVPAPPSSPGSLRQGFDPKPLELGEKTMAGFKLPKNGEARGLKELTNSGVGDPPDVPAKKKTG